MPFQTTLGPYDYWAIEYAYKPLPPGSRPKERAELQRIAARSNEPLLAFGTDEDNAFGIDPETIQLDLGADPIAFAAKRLEIARDLFRRQETRELSPDATMRCCAARWPMRLPTPRARWACWCARSAACARCATFRAAGATRCSPVPPTCSARRSS